MKREKYNRKNRGRLSSPTGSLFTCMAVVILSLFFYGTTVINASTGTGAICHVHTGDGLSEGGCYSAELCGGNIVARTREITCGGVAKTVTQTQWCCVNGHVDNNNVGNGWYEFPHSERCNHIVGTVTYYVCEACGTEYPAMQDSCTMVTGFIAACGYEEGEEIATLYLNSNTDSWAQELTLDVNIQSKSDLVEINPPVWKWSGPDMCEEAQLGTTNKTMVIKQNGTYSVRIESMDSLSAAEACITVTNIDRTSPVVDRCDIQYENSDTEAVVTISVTEQASGLGNQSYSWDNGQSYTSSAVQKYYANGVYHVIIRDIAGNQTGYRFEITGIKKPTVSDSETESTQNDKQNTTEQDKHNTTTSIDTSARSENDLGSLSQGTSSDKLTIEVKKENDKIKDDTNDTKINKSTEIYFGLYSMEDLVLRKTSDVWGIGDVGNLITLKTALIPGTYGVGELRFASFYTDQILNEAGNYIYDENMNRVITTADTPIYEAIKEEKSLFSPLFLFSCITLLSSGAILFLYNIIRR